MQPILIRILDVILSLAGIIVGLPIMLSVYFTGLFVNGSPLFFQQRVGKNQEPFTLIKFRTMAITTGSVGTHLVDAASITKLGHFLRKAKFDEMPQLFNVLFGHMSLVGPRPCLHNQMELVEEREKRGLYEVRPGITGLAQINDVDMSTPRKLARYDQIMINNMSIKFYIKLIITTAMGKGGGDRVKSTQV